MGRQNCRIDSSFRKNGKKKQKKRKKKAKTVHETQRAIAAVLPFDRCRYEHEHLHFALFIYFL